MKKSSKSFSFIAACIILGISLAGCGTNSIATQTNPQQTNTSTQNQTTVNSKSTTEDTPLNHSGQTSKLETVPTLDMQPVKYSQSQLTEVLNTAKKLGIKAFLPQVGTTGDQLTLIKNSGDSLVLDYENFWIVESTKQIPKPISPDQEPDTFSVNTWEYITTNFGNITYLYLQKGSTFICIENLKSPLTEWQLMAIGSSFKSAQP